MTDDYSNFGHDHDWEPWVEVNGVYRRWCPVCFCIQWSGVETQAVTP